MRYVVVGALVGLSACVGWLPRRGSETVIGGPAGGDRGMPTSTGAPAKATGVSKKAVFGKREPVTLIARDKTECIVPESRFKETAIGEEVRCEWRAP